MFHLFKRKKGKKQKSKLISQNYYNAYETSTQPTKLPDNKMARLMELIGHAIEEWAIEYHLENLPKKIVFEQALDAMQAIDTMQTFEFGANNKEK